ncbi:hypothetical protein [Hydrogenimonas sp. SS33]|uniref:hypothetical protein n=1 Tax=Hydrogenimonas leucolamina TaxID=2954236 RepID=UPI00336BFD0B
MNNAFKTLLVWMLIFVSAPLYAYRFRLLFPHPGSVLHEGETYTLRWKSDLCGKMCITAYLGGHERGPLDDCRIDARSGEFEWHIPKGYISGFGITREDHTVLEFSIPVNDVKIDFFRSMPFTIVVPEADHHPRPNPIRFPPVEPLGNVTNK